MLDLGKPKRAKCLEVRVGDNVHAIPLSANMPIPFAKKLKDVLKAEEAERDELATDLFLEYFGAYMGSDLDLLDMEDLVALISAWEEESTGSGVTPGESQASSS